MDSGTGIGKVNAQAGLRLGMIGVLSTLHRSGADIAFPSRDHLHTTSAEHGTEFQRESERESFLRMAGFERGSGIVATMCGVQHHHELL